MRKEIKIVLIVITIMLVIFGIIVVLNQKGRNIYPDFSDDVIAFYTSEYNTDIEGDNEGYLTFEYNGRTYMPYGTLKGFLKEKDIDKCIGYIVQDENNSSITNENNKDVRVYTLVEDQECNFLMDYYIGTTLINQPGFYRAVDTKGQDIVIPDFIDSLDYEFWR